MRRLTKTERAAAAAVLAMAAGVAGTGITLLKKHTRLLAQKAAARFGREEEAVSSEGDNKQDETEETAWKEQDKGNSTEK